MRGKTLVSTLRHLSPWRLILLIVLFYVVIRVAIPWLIQASVPFWARALFLAGCVAIGAVCGPWLYPRQH